MAYGWRQESITLNVELGDLVKMAKLPGKKGEWYVEDIECTDGDKLDMDSLEDRAVKITFGRNVVAHNIKGGN